MIGEIVGHYKILEKLGGGGMGIIYKAQDIKLDRFVALKFLPPAFSMDEEFKQSIINEAKIAATIDHPNVCNIHEVGETEDDRIFIAMAFYQGESLKKKIKKGNLNKNEIENVIMQTAKGLEAAHDKGIVHRDIKPENIFITDTGEVKILDFGVAKLEGDYSVMDAEKITGTISYMSPEQIIGQEVDHRSDIWSFGILIYELVTGSKPFHSQYEQSALYSIINDDPDLTNFSEVADLSYLKGIVQRCLEKNKEARFQSISTIIESINYRYIPTNYSNNKLVLSIKVFVMTGLGIIIILVAYWFSSQFQFGGESRSDKQRLAVLPFKDLTSTSNDSSNFPLLLQSLVVDHLTDYDKIAIVDPASLNRFIQNTYGNLQNLQNLEFYAALEDLDISYLIEGTVRGQQETKSIKASIISVAEAEVKHSCDVEYSDEDSFLKSVDDICNQFLNYFYIKFHPYSVEKDLLPFVRSRCRNILAEKAFLQACQLVFMQARGARDYLELSIKLDSFYIPPRIWLISNLAQTGELKEAGEHLEFLKILESSASPFDQSMINWASGFLENDFSKQIKYLDAALEYSPNNNILLYNLARIYYLMNDYKKVVQTLDSPVKTKWNYSAAHALAGYCCYKIGKLDEAKVILEESLEITPVFESIYSFLSLFYYLSGDSVNYRNYKDLFVRRSKEIGYKEDEIFSNLAELFKDEGQYKEAVRSYKKAIDANSKNPVYHENLAYCYLEMEKHTMAKEEFLKTAQLDSLNSNSHYFLGKLLLKQNIINEAKSHFIKYLEIDSLTERADSVKVALKNINNNAY